MSLKIDIKFLAGLLIGAVVVGSLVILFTGGDEDPEPGNASQNSSLEPVAPGAGATEDGEEEDEGDKGDEEGGNARGPALALPVPEGEGKIDCPAPTATVSDAASLETALKGAKAGDVIKMNPGTYQGKFVTKASGTQQQPIYLCGDAKSILDGGGVDEGYGFHLEGANYWRLIGFTVTNSQKGVMGDGTNGSIIQGLTVHEIGDEAVHLRKFSTGNTVQYNKIYNTGLRREKFGEGVYLGSAESNFEKISGGQPDKSDNNVVRGNVIRATAEAIDIKEGTSGGKILNNVFDGTKTGGSKHNDSWIDVKGNNYLIQGNKGTGTPLDGFQTHEIIDGWGKNNIFTGNTIDLGGGNGVGINDVKGGNTVKCDNKMVNGGKLTTDGKCS
ncbi:right-handed parallel beta-helix repeat-containing protein [Actinomadura sp. LOL_016]|uniref:right-handed parallel beta-helix repeat-containing protein n=1 Tax=unclassified Actinomadura TaxID=2626254 RepID=UPI003A7FCE43